MVNEEVSTHILVPEIALLTPLPKHIRSRFAKALHLMHQHLQHDLSWEKIAIKSAISPYHFHRQFKQLFNEPPGQYHSRVRLQHAANLLLQSQPLSITTIAQQCGFSSSQALAKAVKRELGVTAKTIQRMAKQATPDETSQLLDQLAHRQKTDSFEHKLAKQMPTEIIWYDKRSYKQLQLPDNDWDHLLEQFNDQVVDLVTLTPISQLDKPWDQIKVSVGDWRCDFNEHDNAIPEGHYLCTNVLIASSTAYLTALETLFTLAKQQGLKIDYRGQLIESVLDANENNGVTFSFQLPILD
ncbi:MAG: helix-turn-helix transcriptional regulator [Psychromonas sp.]|nr:helix-turn-helix transcriptional regulator [Alteromonadales bacterium]MCP5079353.1 helix-turn-helix transcriptional regulator [Psychromonas sp.]